MDTIALWVAVMALISVIIQAYFQELTNRSQQRINQKILEAMQRWQ